MSFLLVDFILNIDTHLESIIANYGTLTYAILFGIILIETGLVVMPFLPGDSLLFAAGAFAAKDVLNPIVLVVLLSLAAIIGDTLNYWVGLYLGPKVFTENRKFLNKKHLVKAEMFYEKYGPKAIILARFIPIIRTFAPFVAGIGKMHYGKFLTYNVVGGVAWVTLFTLLGYFFGTIPFVAKHFELVIIAIIAISFVPPVVELIRSKKSNRILE